MVQLLVLTGRKAGTQVVARRFPFRVGRAPGAEFSLDDPGVWDWHLEITLDSEDRFRLKTLGEALATANGERIQDTQLRNGDLVDCGSARIRFGLSPTRQRSLLGREILTWIALGLLCLGQVALIYWLPG